ncbi:MAG TPA: ABC transporter ATP-binding protein, partial [Candidatus Salinicoccus merdavium]|nr:ABC transporter ATP-binding protein [Candidatus Salinicoccus merdavium]
MTEIKRLLKYSLDYKWWFIAGNILMVLMVFFQLLGPLIIMTVIDNHIRLGEGNINVEAVIRLLIIYALIKLFHAVAAYYAQIILQSSGAKVVQSIRHQVFEHIQKLPVRYFDNLPAGKVVARITNDTESMLQFFTYVLPMFLVNGLTMIAITAAIFIVNIYAGIIMLIFVPIILLWLILYR